MKEITVNWKNEIETEMGDKQKQEKNEKKYFFDVENSPLIFVQNDHVYFQKYGCERNHMGFAIVNHNYLSKRKKDGGRENTRLGRKKPEKIKAKGKEGNRKLRMRFVQNVYVDYFCFFVWQNVKRCACGRTSGRC